VVIKRINKKIIIIRIIKILRAITIKNNSEGIEIKK